MTVENLNTTTAELNAAGEGVFDKPLPRDEARLRELINGLQQHGRRLVIVDQPNNRYRRPFRQPRRGTAWSGA